MTNETTSEQGEFPGRPIETPTDIDEVRHTAVVGLIPLARPKYAKIKSSENVLCQIIQLVTKRLPQLASSSLWDEVLRATQLLLWLTHHVPGATILFIAAKGTARMQDVVRAAAGSSDPAALSVLQPATALLLVCVKLSESAADLVVESQSVRLLLQLLTRHDVGASTKRHTGDILQALAATKLVYRDVLHGAGVVEVLMSAFTDASVTTDLLLLQKLLWVLISLSDDDVVYKDDMRQAGLPAAMVALFSVYQANQGVAELRPIAAQILRCLHLMAHDDQQVRLSCQRLGLIPLLVSQLHLDIHQMDEPPLPAAAAANILNLNSMPTTPRSPVKAASSSSAGATSPFTPSSPLRRSGSSGSGNSSPRGTGGGGRRSSALEPPIPEETEMEDVDMPESPTAGAGGGSNTLYPSSLGLSFGGRSAGFPHSSEAAALRGLGAGPSAVVRVAAAALLREVLAGVMSERTIEVLLHGLLLPACYMQLVGPRLSLAMEATSALLALLTDNTHNQAAAVKAGVVPLLVQLLSVRNVDLASTAAEVITLIATSGAVASSGASAGCLGPYTAAAVRGLADLLKECAAHAYALGPGRRKSISATAAVDGRASIDWRATDHDRILSPVQEAVEETPGASSSSTTRTTVGSGLSGTGWASDKQQQHQWGLGHQSSLVLRHPSLNRDATPDVQQKRHAATGSAAQHDYSGGTSTPPSGGRLSLTLHRADRISSTSVGVSGGHCLVNSHEAHESCGFCPLSSTIIALCTLLSSPALQLQQQALAAGCVEVLVGLLAGEVCHVVDHSRLLAALAYLTALVVQGNTQAQDQVRQAGGLDIVSEALERVATSTAAAAAANMQEDVLQLSVGLLQLLTALVCANSANKLCVREAGVFQAVASLLDTVVRQSGVGLDGLSQALLQFLISSLQESPGCQAEACQQGVTGILLNLLRLPSSDHNLGYLIIQVLGLLANKAQPAALSEVTAGGLVSVVMNVLQQQAMAGVLVSEVCVTVLPGLLDGNPPGKTQALGYGVLPLLVHLLRSSPSAATVAAAAQTIAVLADKNTELQGQIISAGGLHALLDKLDPANAAAAAANAAAAQAAAAAANAAAEAASEVVAKAAADANSSTNGMGASAAEMNIETATDAVAAEDSNNQQHHMPLSNAADSILKAVAAGDATGGGRADKQQQAAALTSEQLTHLEAQQKLAQVKVRVACLEAVAALAHDNMFSKNTARQQGIMPLIVDLLARGRAALQDSAASAMGASRQQRPHSSGDLGPVTGECVQHVQPLRVRTPRSSQHQQQAAASSPEQLLEQRTQAAHLQMLITAVQVVKEICHGAHSNQQAAAAEGLIDQLTSLAALALGSSLEEAAAHRLLLSAVADALSAVCEFCHSNKLVARDCGGVEVLSRVILMAAEAPHISILGSLRLHYALAACCGAVVALAQDCDEDQRSFTSHPDFLPALFRLMSVDDPGLATQAARALEFIAIRNDYADDADDRSEFEADTVMALIRTLAHGAIAISGSGRAAVARVAVGGAVGAPAAAVIREAAGLLAQVAEASQAAAGCVHSSAATGSSIAPSRTVSGLGTAPAHPSGPPTASSSAKQLQTTTSVKQQQQQQQGGVAAAPAAATHQGAGAQNFDVLSPRPAALLPAVVTDHTSGLAVLRTWSMQEDTGGMWQALVARAAPAFQPVAAAVAEGPWKPFKLQVAWMLLLLAGKSPDNCAIVSRVQRTTLLPLAMQLENAERFYQQAAEVEAATHPAPARREGATSSSTGGAAGAASSRRNTGTGVTAAEAQPTGTGSVPAEIASAAATVASPNAAGEVPAAASSNNALGQPSGLDDDELSMLQAEVAFLGLMSSNNSSNREPRAGS